MPYIKQDDRELMDPSLDAILETVDEFNVGDLNYIITSIAHRWIKKQGLRYVNLNAVIGMLECAKLELSRVVVAPYEDTKIHENGCISKLDGDPDDINKEYECMTCGRIFLKKDADRVTNGEAGTILISPKVFELRCPTCHADSKDWKRNS